MEDRWVDAGNMMHCTIYDDGGLVIITALGKHVVSSDQEDRLKDLLREIIN